MKNVHGAGGKGSYLNSKLRKGAKFITLTLVAYAIICNSVKHRA